MTLPAWVPPPISQLFNLAIGEYGQDYQVPLGTPIKAPWDGTFSSEDKGSSAWGKRAFVHGGPGGLTFAVGHLQSFAGFAPGQQVHKGDIVGYSGGAYSLHPDGSVQSSGPHVEVQFIKGAATYLNPQNIPGIGQLEQVIFGSAKTIGAAAGAPGSTPNPLDALNPFNAVAAQLAAFNKWVGQAGWVALGVLVILAGILLLVFEDFESAGKQLAQAAIQSSPSSGGAPASVPEAVMA